MTLIYGLIPPMAGRNRVKAKLKKNVAAFKKTIWSYWKPEVPTYLSSVKHGNDTEDIAAKKFQSKSENQDLLVVPSGELILQSKLNYMYI